MSKRRTYSEMIRLQTFDERFSYLRLGSELGKATFGFDRWLNQQFYRSKEWKDTRRHVIIRDEGCDLAIREFEIFDTPLVHHMNPMTIEDVEKANFDILDPNYLITVSLTTHNAIHFGAGEIPHRPFVERSRGDTRLW